MECLRPWEPLLVRHDREFGCALGAEPHAHAVNQGGRNQLVCNAVMLSAPRHGLWERVFARLLRSAQTPEALEGLSPVDTTGPVLLALGGRVIKCPYPLNVIKDTYDHSCC
jgi:hypothetical protein